MTILERSALPTWKNPADNNFFYRLTAAFLLITVLFTFVVSIVELPEKTREEKEKIPPQLVKILEEKVEVEPPKPEPIPEAEPEPVPEIEAEPEPEPEPEVVPEPEPEPEPTQAEKEQKAKVKAETSGLLALSDELSEMRDSVDVDNLADNELVEGAGDAAETERVLLGATAKGTSGGVKNSALSADVGSGNNMAGRKTTEFTARVATTGGDETDQTALMTERELASGNRSTESIRQIFDKNKGALYAIYRRALREDPSLQGKVTVRLIILPSGSVQSVKIVSTDLDHEGFTKKLLARIKLISFGAQDVKETELNYTFNFLPF